MPDPTVGVAISTHARPDTLTTHIQHWTQHCPGLLVITHDIHGEGIAATKNRGIATLMNAGIEHLFLVDDDMHPLTPDWWQPYVHDPLPHLMHCWGRTRLINDDSHYTTWTHPRGVMLYTHRTIINTVGGMRTEFGRWGGEHAEWSRRIHNTGATPHPYMDLTQARHMWHCDDYTRSTPSTVTQAERAATKQQRDTLRNKYRHSTDYVPYQ